MNQEMPTSAFLFQPTEQGLCPVVEKTPACLRPLADKVQTAIQDMISQKDYPCMPALQSFHQNEYLVGLYRGFETGTDSESLVRDLLYFRQKQKSSASLYMSFWAVFPMQSIRDENEFEGHLWKQLSYLSTIGNANSNWDPQFSSDPEDPRFCFSLNGEALFVVGVSPVASRKARRFPYPSLIFNYYDQFTALSELGKYDNIVRLNRQRELRFSGSLNPMVEKYGDHREAIQFSGRENPSDWKCPFQHGLQPRAERKNS